MTDCDLLIVGAGPVGSVLAERAASQRGWRSIVIDRRPHLGGTCHDYRSPGGVRVHSYGPHYFRTDSDSLMGYLSQFTTWVPGHYEARTRVRGKLLPFPINLDTLEGFFGRTFGSEAEARAWMESQRDARIDPDRARNSEERVVGVLGREIFEAFFAGYTRKQWGREARDLDASVCGRVGVRWDRDPRYTRARHQVMPELGLTALFEAMLKRPEITFQGSTAYRDVRSSVRPRVATIYTGPLDEYFEQRLGALPWRSLEFVFEEREGGLVQPCAQINEPDASVPWTRTVEFRHICREEAPTTVLCREFPRAQGDPYYPVPSPESARVAREYLELAEQETRKNRVYFEGRLARYAYLNMDEAFEAALKLWDRVVQDHDRRQS